MKKTSKNYKDVFIVIPAYFEGPTIQGVVKDLNKHNFKNIIVVNDGNPDNTREECAKCDGLYYLEHIVNRGKGAAIRTGIDQARQLGAQAVVTFDGDGQHVPSDIPKLLDGIAEGYDVVLGSRKYNTKDMPLIKVLANTAGNLLTWMLFGIWVSDSQSGLRAFSKKAFDLIETKADRYAYDPEVLKEMKRHRLTYTEVPVSIVYNKHSQTKAERQSFITGLKTLLNMLKSA